MLTCPRFMRPKISDAGFTLTETIVSLAIIGVVLTSTGAFMSRTSDLMRDGLAAQAAQQQLTLEIARIQSVPFDDLALPEFGQTSCAAEGRPVTTAINATGTIVQGDVSMTVNRAVTWAGSGDQALIGEAVTCGATAAAAQMKQADVEVRYTLPTGESGTVKATVLRSAGSESVVSIAAGPGAITVKPNESKVSTLAGSTMAGFLSGAGSSARFKEPGDVAVHPTTGQVFVADTFNHAIRTINPSNGNVTTVLGGTGRGSDINGKPTPDSTFNANVNGDVWAVEPYANGRTVIAGNFTSVNGTTRNRIARLNADGTLDTTFNPGSGANNPVTTVAVQPDGKILIGGSFTSVNGTARNRIARLNADGTLDTGFGTYSLANNAVTDISLQTDGRILIGGSFTSVNGTVRNRIARLTSDGSLDFSFGKNFPGVNGTVLSVNTQTDGKLLIGGEFSTVNGTPRISVARLNADGTLDTSFTGPGAIVGGPVFVVRPHQSGVLVGGSFTSINGRPVLGIAKLTSNGLLDTSFGSITAYNAFPEPVLVRSIAVDADNRILLAGSFTRMQSENRSYLARLNPNGTIDTSLNTYGGPDGIVLSVAVAPDGKLLIGGAFTRYGNVNTNRISRINPNGTASFNMIAALAFAPDGTLYATDRWNNRILRINTTNWQVQVLAGRWPGFLNGTGESASFLNPGGLAVGGDGNIYVADTGNNAIRKITPSGVVTTVAGSPGTGYINGSSSTAKFNQPWDVVVAPTGDIYVSDWFNHAIRKITPSGTVTTHAGRVPGGDLTTPLAPQQLVAQPGDERVYLTWTPPLSNGGTPITGYQVQWSSNNGAAWTTGTRASQWTGFTVTELANGTSYVFRVRAMNITGAGPWSAVTSAVTPSKKAPEPTSVPVNAVNDLVATDGLFRDGVGSAARFNNPMGLTLDANNGIIYVADQMNHLIRAVTYSGAVTTVAGSQSGYADSAARASRFMRPTGMAFTSGQLIIADTGNNIIRRLTLP